MRMCSPTKASRRETERDCGGVGTYNERSLCVKYHTDFVLRVHPFYEIPRGRYGLHNDKTRFKATGNRYP